MSKLKGRLAALAKALGLQTALLQRARRRYRAFHKRAFKAMEQKQAAQAAADEARAAGHLALAARKDKKALELEAVEIRERTSKVFWRGRVKDLHKRVAGVETDNAAVEAELKAWKKEHGVSIRANKVTGGTPGQRWRAALLASCVNCANGKRRNFYSMTGDWDINHEIVGGPEYGHRSDCSSTVTGWAKACGLPDPNGAHFTGGYTGTLVGQHNGWREVSQHEMETGGRPAYIVYGEGVGHHTEGYPTKGSFTCGHGDANVDHGQIDDFGDGDFRCFAYFGK